MSDDDVVRGEEKKLRDARWQKVTRAIAKQWAETGYNPRGHLQGITAEGDHLLMVTWLRDDARPVRISLGTWLAAWDMHDQLTAVGVVRFTTP